MGVALHPADVRRTLGTVSIVALLVVSALMIRGGSPVMIGALIAMIVAPFAIYVAAARPLIFPYGLYVLLIPFDNLLSTGQFGTLTKFLGFLSAVCLIGWCVRYRTALTPPRSFVALTTLLWWFALSTYWAVDQSESLAMLGTFAGLAVLYFALAITPVSLSQYRFLLYAIACAGMIAAAYGASVFYHDPSLAAQDLVNRRLVLHAANIYIDPNEFADALLFPAAIVIGVGIASRRILMKLAGVAAISLIGLTIALSGSREGVVGLLVVGLYYAWRSRHRLQIVFVLLAAFAAAAATQNSMWVRFSSALATGGSGRTAVWSVGLEAFKHNWLTGYGIGNFINVYDTYYLQVYQAYSNGWGSAAHNIVIRYLVETGIIGMLIICWFLWEQFRTLHVIDKKNPLYDYRIMLESALISTIVVSTLIDLFHYKYVWVLFAMVVQLRNVVIRSETAPAPAERLQFSRT